MTFDGIKAEESRYPTKTKKTSSCTAPEHTNEPRQDEACRVVYPKATNDDAPNVSIRRVLNKGEAAAVEKAAGELGPDPGSGKLFIERKRNLVFVLRAGNRWLTVNQDFLEIASDYNGTKGGYRRYFRGMPDTFLEDPHVLKLLNHFADYYGIPDGQIMLLLIQMSVVTPENMGLCTTGDGIHSDGVDVCMMSVLRRENIAGARSAAFEDTLGERICIGPKALEPGECLFWRDNRVYHYVEPAKLIDPTKPGYRTVLVIGYPGIHQVIGISNPNNTMPPSGLHPPFVRVRDHVDDEIQTPAEGSRTVSEASFELNDSCSTGSDLSGDTAPLSAEFSVDDDSSEFCR